jgi:hypothetical protein
VSVRTELVALLTPLLPTNWRIVPTNQNLDTLDRTVMQLKQQSLRPLPAAPNARLEVTYIATVISRHTDIVKAELELDESVLTFISALDALDAVLWSDATKVMANDDKNLAYDITLTIHTEKD